MQHVSLLFSGRSSTDGDRHTLCNAISSGGRPSHPKDVSLLHYILKFSPSNDFVTLMHATLCQAHIRIQGRLSCQHAFHSRNVLRTKLFRRSFLPATPFTSQWPLAPLYCREYLHMLRVPLSCRRYLTYTKGAFLSL